MNKAIFTSFLLFICSCLYSQAEWHPIDRGLSDFALVNVITQKDSRIYVGGRYFAVNGENSFDDIFLSTDNYSWNAPACPSFTFQAIYDIQVYGDDLIVGGAFSGIGGDDELANLAIWDGANWQSVGGGLNGTVHDILVHEDKVYVGGNFTDAGGDPDADRIAYWDGNEWHALGKGFSTSVRTLEWGNDNLYVGGTFGSANGGEIFARAIARWDGEEWYALTDNLNGFSPNAVVFSLLFHDDQLYVGSRNGVKLYTGAAYEDIGSILLYSNIYEIAVHQGTLYIGGSFENAGNDPDADFVARWNGQDWENIGVTPNGDVYSIFSTGDELYLGGDFSNLNQNPLMDGIARYGVLEPPYLQYCDNDADIAAIESLLLSATDYEDRQDYHEYTVENEVCDASNDACTFNDVWALLKSDLSFQVPIREDYEIFEVNTPYANLEKGFLPSVSYDPVPITDCAEVVVPNLINQIAVMTTLSIPGNDFQSDCPMLQNSLVPQQDTVLLKVDEARRCVTSYTRSGHLMYSSKVERCVSCDDEGNVYIETRGRGLHACGDNDMGAFLSRFNELRVSDIYDEVDARMAEEF